MGQLAQKRPPLLIERVAGGYLELELMSDPLPYGIEPNRKVLEELLRHALTQKIITQPVSVDELFAPATRALVG